MEHREQRNDQAENNSRTISPATSATLEKLKNRRRGKLLRPQTRTIIFDNSTSEYSWLLPGWVAEERHMVTGRIYRYYYDPDGRLYRSRDEVAHAWEQSGLVVLD